MERLLSRVRGKHPAADPFIDALSDRERAELGALWERRAAAELSVAAHFAFLTRELIASGAEPAVWRAAAQAVGDETRHTELCVALASRYLDRDVTPPASAPTDVPVFPGADAALLPWLYVIALCCCNETIASVRLEEALAPTRSPSVRATLRAILADEVHHARIGWAHLAGSRVTSALRLQLRPWLSPLLQASVERGLHEDALSNEAHGLPSYAATRETIAGALDEVVLPGFSALGFDISEARRYAKTLRLPPPSQR